MRVHTHISYTNNACAAKAASRVAPSCDGLAMHAGVIMLFTASPPPSSIITFYLPLLRPKSVKLNLTCTTLEAELVECFAKFQIYKIASYMA
jgi:hypothetical protein